MKTYKEFITELNKFEKFLFKQGVKAIKKLNPKIPLKRVKKEALRTTKGLRSDINNPFVSPRRENENILKKFNREVFGKRGENIMKLKDKTGKPKYVEYDPTRVRQGDDAGSAALGTFTMRGQSKKEVRNMDKKLKELGKRSENARSILKNTGDQHSAIYKAPNFKYNPSDDKIDSLFPKNRIGAPTTTNIPKDILSDLDRFTPAKDIKAKSIIRAFKRRKK